MSDILTARELATRLGVTTDTVYRRTAAGEIPHFRIGRDVRYVWTEVRLVLHRGPDPTERESDG
jgi:excisionase family DNA binding protein